MASIERMERSEQFGRNVEIRATFMRHGPKAEATDITAGSLLSPAGRGKVKEVGQNLQTKPSGVKSYTSPVARAIETANLIMQEQTSKGAKIFKQRQRTELTLIPGSKEFYNKLVEQTKANLPGNYNELQGTDKQEAFERAEDKSLNWYLSLADKKPDAETASPREMAASVAKLVYRYINMAERLKDNSQVDLINVSHKGTLEPFLKETLRRRLQDENGQEKIVSGFNQIEEIGGGMRPAESWVLDISTDQSGEKIVKILLRGQEYSLDLKRVEELAH